MSENIQDIVEVRTNDERFGNKLGGLIVIQAVGDVALKLYAVRPDGSSWTETWDLVIRPKIQTAMNRCASEAVKLGLVLEEDGERVWEEWSKGFLSDEWDGSTFDKDYARRLLQNVSYAEDVERRKDRWTQDEMEALRAQLVGLAHVTIVPPPRNDSDDGSKDRQRSVPASAPADEPARRGQNEEDQDEVVPGDVVVSSDALPAEPIPVASDVARVFDDMSLAMLENWLRRGWASSIGRGRGRQPDNDRIIAIREAREKLLEEIFFLEDVIDDRRPPFRARPRRYPGQGLVYKYFLGGDGPSGFGGTETLSLMSVDVGGMVGVSLTVFILNHGRKITIDDI
ncbi:hypothetical protein K456DRAFT_1947378 [Colletotrichum gloeosporioides 23]|nr:hypothetical protein K456DRAFT_1947378 [Colletotrichum gloeosporioides 23]